MKYNNLNLGQIEAIVNKIGGMDGVEKLLRDELIITEKKPKWTEKDGVIRFSVTSDYSSGEQWITRLQNKGFCVSNYIQTILQSTRFMRTDSGTYEIAVLKGEIFSDDERIITNIRKEAKKRNLRAPNADIACLIREKFSDKELEDMGLYWIIAIHEPIKDSGYNPKLLGAYRRCGGSLDSDHDNDCYKWCQGSGFAFLAS